SRKLGEVTGGGTSLLASREVASCEIEIHASSQGDAVVREVIQILEILGAPKGSTLQGGGRAIPFGITEGLALYLNGTDLGDEVYENGDVNFVVDELGRLVENEGRMYSYWEGPTETALYLYGRSFAAMKTLIDPLVTTYPLCRQCRIVQVA